MIKACQYRKGMICELRRAKLPRSQHPITVDFCNNVCVKGREQESMTKNVDMGLVVVNPKHQLAGQNGNGCGGCKRKKIRK